MVVIVACLLGIAATDPNDCCCPFVFVGTAVKSIEEEEDGGGGLPSRWSAPPKDGRVHAISRVEE